jgi:cytochrome P450
MSKSAPISKGFPIFGHLISYQKDRLSLLKSHQEKYGTTFKIKLGPKLITVLTDPEDVEKVLLTNMNNYIKKTNFEMIFRKGLFTSNGESWKSQRVSVQSLFSPAYLEQCTPKIVDTTKLALQEYNPQSVTDVNEFYSKLTFGLIINLVIGYDFTNDFSKLHEDLNYCSHYLTYDSYNPFPWSSLLSPYSKKGFEEALARIDETVFKSLKEQEDPSMRKEYSIVSKMMAAESSGKLSHVNQDLLRDNVVGLMFAGYETTALTLAWISWLLAKHPDVQDKVREELKSLTTFEKQELQQLPYTEAVINETMRLYPAGWAFTRVAVNEDKLKSTDISPGEIVFLSPYLTQRDEKNWSEANLFKPERFLQGDLKDKARFAFFPFGGGPRLCVGRGLGILEMKVILKFMLEKFTIDTSGDDPIPFPLATFQTKNGFKLILKKR